MRQLLINTQERIKEELKESKQKEKSNKIKTKDKINCKKCIPYMGTFMIWVFVIQVSTVTRLPREA